MFYSRPFLVLLFLSFLGSSLFSQKKVESKIDSLTLFLNGAEVHRSADLELKKGKNRILLPGLSPELRSESIRLVLSEPENARILSLSDKVNMFDKGTHQNEIEELSSELRTKELRIDSLRNIQNGYQEEKEMMLSNRDIGGEGANISSTSLGQMADLFRDRIITINQEVSAIERKIRKTREEKRKVQRQLNELNAKSSYRTSEVEVLFDAESNTNLTINLDYLVNRAGWVPFYDIRGKGVNKPVELTYKAKVFNNTDVDWDDVTFNLSTGDPGMSVSKPDLDKWTLDYYQGGSNINIRGSRSNPSGFIQKGKVSQKMEPRQKVQDKVQRKDQQQKVEYTEIEVSQLSAEFSIEESYSIPSNAKPYIVEVTEYELPATFRHYTVPKLEKSVFLLAKITGWETLDLVEGNANIYFDGNYKGRSYIKPSGVGDTMDISMGRDKKVRVDRVIEQDYTSSQLIGNSRKDALTYSIKIRNDRKNPIDIEVQDQYPISKADEIDVKLTESSDADVNESKGILTWSFTLGAGKKEEFTLSYEIKYPKDKTIRRQQYRKQESAKF